MIDLVISMVFGGLGGFLGGFVFMVLATIVAGLK